MLINIFEYLGTGDIFLKNHTVQNWLKKLKTWNKVFWLVEVNYLNFKYLRNIFKPVEKSTLSNNFPQQKVQADMASLMCKCPRNKWLQF